MASSSKANSVENLSTPKPSATSTNDDNSDSEATPAIEIKREDVKRAPSKFKSSVWEHFGLHKDFKDKAICLDCLLPVSNKDGNTSNMRSHLKRSHGTLDTPKKTPSTPKPALIGQLSIKAALQARTKMPHNHVRAQAITRAIGDFIAMDLQPFDVVEGDGFRALIHQLEPRYVIPSRKIFTQQVIPKMYEEKKESLKKVIAGARSFSFTTDSWTSRATENYITIPIHVTDDSWNPHAYILNTVQCNESHTAEHLSELLTNELKEWEINIKDQSFTTDNAKNITKAIQATGARNVRCYAHTLNLAVQKGLSSGSIDGVLSKVRKVVAYFHRSTTAAGKLREKQEQLGLPVHKLVMDVKTRWNSCLDMVSRYLEQRVAIMAALEALKAARVGKKKKKEQDLAYDISGDDVTALGDLVSVLQSFKDVTMMISSETTVTVSVILPMTAGLLEGLTEETTEKEREEGGAGSRSGAGDDSDTESESDEEEKGEGREGTGGTGEDGVAASVSKIKAMIKADLESRYQTPQERAFLGQASFLDPRFKALPFLSGEERKTVEQQVMQAAVDKLECKSSAVQERRANDPELAGPAVAPAAAAAQADGAAAPPPKKKPRALSSLLGKMFPTAVTDDKESGEGKNEMAVLRELCRYKGEPPLDLDECPFKWWREHQGAFPYLATLAKEQLIIQATSVSSERVFSTAGDIVSAKRTRLSEENVNMLLFLHKNRDL